jgi:broad specificity phosphatase PhoE
LSTLTLVRHGQAEPFQRESARLTQLGEAQAAKLAEFWLRQGVQFDEVHCGRLARQIRTEQVVAETFRTAGQPWPEVSADSSWNEYDAPGVLTHLAPKDPRLAALAEEFEQMRSGPESNRYFVRMLEAAMLQWLDGAACNGVEPWSAFHSRVSTAIRRLMEGHPSRRIVVFTSGGVIGFAVHLAFYAPPRSFLDVNWRVRNSSFTQFVFDRERFTLDSFNSLPHLDDPGTWTYR